MTRQCSNKRSTPLVDAAQRRAVQVHERAGYGKRDRPGVRVVRSWTRCRCTDTPDARREGFHWAAWGLAGCLARGEGGDLPTQADGVRASTSDAPRSSLRTALNTSERVVVVTMPANSSGRFIASGRVGRRRTCAGVRRRATADRARPRVHPSPKRRPVPLRPTGYVADAAGAGRLRRLQQTGR